MREQTTIYRYGLLAWLWRTFILGFLIAGIACLTYGVLKADASLLVLALVLLAPVLFFGAAVAVRVDRLSNGQVQVWTLLFWRRRLRVEQVGPTRRKPSAVGESGPPGIWVPVKKGLPIYLDPLANISDRKAFAATFRLPISDL